ncbi:Telomere-associated protein 1 [Penicillium ucsense]|uniref:Telomere-associated protein 1 n=1 Tax=Penicillium ucsense TaxID=2839758 RepID=A0A8J8W6U5_9EURO|nr:Telomere-associated protein 1 [Penicillium ucsense]KAF7737143.1 Telomere-associated protein 1 [Penicillium ucsense]
MDPSGGPLRALDDALHRELPQLPLRIAPLREPVSSRALSAPAPLEPTAIAATDPSIHPQAASSAGGAGGNLTSNNQTDLPTVKEYLHAARTKRAEPSSTDLQSNVESPPKPILPAFVNLRALERFPFSSSFDDDALHGPRKRRRIDLQPESFSEHLQLPIPQAHKEPRPPPFGPFAILNGLNEPPPNAALLPPIEAGSSISQLLNKPSRRDDALGEAGNISSATPTAGQLSDARPSVERPEVRGAERLAAGLVESNHQVDHLRQDHVLRTQSEPDGRLDETRLARATKVLMGNELKPQDAPDEEEEPMSPKTRGRSRKNLRKWTEEETNALLRGVVKCGIGNWTAILAQPELKFNKRTASNLKDRFRVCCPWAYRASDPNEAIKLLRDQLANSMLKAQAGDSTNKPGSITLPSPMAAPVRPDMSSSHGSTPGSAYTTSSGSSMSLGTPDTEPGSFSISQQGITPGWKSSVSSDQSQASLASLGLPEAHVATKVKRRSRRPFTTAEDEALLKGYAIHGFQWTLIQQDQRFNLGHRRATDLRDRFRTKFPRAYREGGTVRGTTPNLQSRDEASSANTHSAGPHDQVSVDPPTLAKNLPFANCPPKPLHHHQQQPPPPQQPSAQHSNPVPFESTLLPPPPNYYEQQPNSGPGNSAVPPDDNAAAGTSSWEDNTLAPMIWDDLS